MKALSLEYKWTQACFVFIRITVALVLINTIFSPLGKELFLFCCLWGNQLDFLFPASFQYAKYEFFKRINYFTASNKITVWLSSFGIL